MNPIKQIGLQESSGLPLSNEPLVSACVFLNRALRTASGAAAKARQTKLSKSAVADLPPDGRAYLINIEDGCLYKHIINTTLFLRMLVRLDERFRADPHGERAEKGRFNSILQVQLFHNYSRGIEVLVYQIS